MVARVAEAVTTAVPPGAHPKKARNIRNSRLEAWPSARRNPASVKSGIAGRSVDVSMGHVNVIWQGDANEQALRLLAHCTAPSSPLNLSGPETLAVRWLAVELGRRLGRAPLFAGNEGQSAWLVDTGAARVLLGLPRVPIGAMLDWTADWIARGGASLGKPTHFETRDGKY